MKKILVLCNHEIVLYNFKKELIDCITNEYDTYISMPFGNSLSYFQNDLNCTCIETKVDRRGINPIKDFKLLLFYKKLVKKIKPDIIFTLTIKPTIYGGLIARYYKLPMITNITGIGTAFQKDNFLKKLIVLLYKGALKTCENCFFENEDNKNVFLENKIVQQFQSKVVNGAGVNLDEFIFSSHYSSNFVFGFVGRVMKEKGVEEFFNCIEHIDRSNVEFKVYGFCEDDYAAKMDELEKKYSFKYMGFCEDRQKIYSEIDCLVLPSYHEGMSNVLLEAAACGRLIITTNICGCKEAVVDGESGLLVNPANYQDLLNALYKVISLTEKQKIAFGKRARKHIEKNFDRKKIVSCYMTEIRKLVTKSES